MFFLLLKDCKEFHQAKDGDGWVEQSSQPFFFGLLQKVCIFIKVEEPLYLLYWPFSAPTSLFCSRKGNSFSLRTWKEKFIIKKIVLVMSVEAFDSIFYMQVDSPCAYVCADSKIYDASEWYTCQVI